jgi:hypothetical protein
MRPIWACARIRERWRCIGSLDASATLIPMEISSLGEFITRYAKLFVLTGGGLQHGFGDPGLSRCEGKLEALPRR